MAVNECKLSEIINKDVFTLRGLYCGKVSDIQIDMSKFRVHGLTIDAAKGSFLAGYVSGKHRGVVVPYSMVVAIGDIVVVKQIPSPAVEEAKA